MSMKVHKYKLLTFTPKKNEIYINVYR